MGWAKFVEDNMELQEERLYWLLNEERYQKETIVQVRTIMPMVAIPIEVSIAVSCPQKIEKPERMLYCRDCGKAFAFSINEQEHFKKRGYCLPKRCKRCRELNKIRNVAYGMRRI